MDVFLRKNRKKSGQLFGAKVIALTTLLLCTISANTYGSEKSSLGVKFTVYGNVFYDNNKNGVKEGYDQGVGGVLINFPDGTTTVTDSLGKYKKEFISPSALVRVWLDENTLPPGSLRTTPAEFYVNKDALKIHNYDFGVHFPEKTTRLTKEPLAVSAATIIVPKTATIKLERRDNVIFINNSKWHTFPKSVKLKKAQLTFPVSFTDIPVTLNEKNISAVKETVRKHHNVIDEVEIEVSVKKTDDPELTRGKASAVATEIRLALLGAGISTEKIKISTRSGKHEANIIIHGEVVEDFCSVKYSGVNYPLADRKTLIIEHEINEEEDLDARCFGESKSIEFPKAEIKNAKSGENSIEPFAELRDHNKTITSIKFEFETSEATQVSHYGQDLDKNIAVMPLARGKVNKLFKVKNKFVSYEFTVIVNNASYASKIDANSDKQVLKIITSKYLQKTRDLDIYVRGESNFDKIRINGQPVAGSGRKFTYVLNGERGHNSLDIVAEKGKLVHKFKHPTPLFMEPTLLIDFNWGLNFKSSTSDYQNYNYSLASLPQATLGANFFFVQKWGIRASYRMDMGNIEVPLADGSTDNVAHSMAEVLLMHRNFFKPRRYDTSKFQLGVGAFYRNFTVPDNASLLVQSSGIGLLVKAELLTERALAKITDYNTALSFGISSTGFLFKVTQELRVNLNVLGGIFGPSHFVYYDRWKFFDDLRLLLSANVEYSSFDTQNAVSGKTTEWLISGAVGIMWFN